MKSIWSCFSNLEYREEKEIQEELLADLDEHAASLTGLGSSLSHENRTQAVDSADNSLGIVVDCINEGDNLVDECLVVTLEEEPQRLLGVSAVLGQYGVVVFSRSLASEAMPLEPNASTRWS